MSSSVTSGKNFAVTVASKGNQRVVLSFPLSGCNHCVQRFVGNPSGSYTCGGTSEFELAVATVANAAEAAAVKGRAEDVKVVLGGGQMSIYFACMKTGSTVRMSSKEIISAMAAACKSAGATTKLAAIHGIKNDVDAFKGGLVAVAKALKNVSIMTVGPAKWTSKTFGDVITAVKVVTDKIDARGTARASKAVCKCIVCCRKGPALSAVLLRSAADMITATKGLNIQFGGGGVTAGVAPLYNCSETPEKNKAIQEAQCKKTAAVLAKLNKDNVSTILTRQLFAKGAVTKKIINSLVVHLGATNGVSVSELQAFSKSGEPTSASLAALALKAC